MSDDEFKLSRPPPKPKDISLVLPTKDILKESSDLAARLNLSHRKTTAITAKLVKIGGGSLSDCSLSVSTSYRHRKSTITEKAEDIRKNFKLHVPENIILHWDSKIIKYQQHHETEDRLAVVTSFPGVDTNDQFLGAPRIANSKGATMANALTHMIQEWEIPASHIKGMCWDTTASNTGCHQGAASVYERQLGEAILWLACRHHIGELHIRHADQEVRGAWNGMFPSPSAWYCIRQAIELL